MQVHPCHYHRSSGDVPQVGYNGRALRLESRLERPGGNLTDLVVDHAGSERRDAIRDQGEDWRVVIVDQTVSEVKRKQRIFSVSFTWVNGWATGVMDGSRMT